MNQTKIEARRLLNIFNHLRIVLHAHAGKLDFDPVFTNGTDQRLRESIGIDTRADDFDGLIELLFSLVLLGLGLGRIFRSFEGETHAAIEVETELEFTLRVLQQVIQQQRIATVDVLDVAKIEIREILGEIDLSLFGNISQSDESARGVF